MMKQAEDAQNIQIQLANMEHDRHIKVATLQHQTAMMEMAARMNISLDQIEAMLTRAAMEQRGKERNLAVETAMAARTGKSAGGSV